MALTIPRRGVTLTETFSICVSPNDIGLIALGGQLADAVTIAGRRGPEVVATMRLTGWECPVLFDRGEYDVPLATDAAEQWFSAQEDAGADRLLSPGTWVQWDDTGDSLSRAIEAEVAYLARRPGATALLSLDARWLSRAQTRLISELSAVDVPIALVLAHAQDPLSLSGAVQALVHVVREVDGVSVLRTDHGGFGALVHGARHAAIGATTTLRHFVPPGRRGFAKVGDATPRLFVPQMLDWFTAATVAGWRTVGAELSCALDCCDGRGVERFLDPRLRADAMLHNFSAIAHVATLILDSPREERRRYFAEMCASAIEHYGPMGKLSMTTQPKQQLFQWACV